MYYHRITDIGGHIPTCFLIYIIWNFNLMKPSAILNLLWWKVPKVYHPLCKVFLNISNCFQNHPKSPGVCIVGIGEPWLCILLTITCMICLVMPSLSLLCSKLSSQNVLIFFSNTPSVCLGLFPCFLVPLTSLLRCRDQNCTDSWCDWMTEGLHLCFPSTLNILFSIMEI